MSGAGVCFFGFSVKDFRWEADVEDKRKLDDSSV